jgi:dTDP-4-amino-4,6-dideoxygalactose transaminase
MSPVAPAVSSISLCDLDALHAPILDKIRRAMDDVIRSHAFINGPQVAELEQQIAEYCGVGHAVGCSSGSDALLMSLMAVNVAPGDEIITTPFTFFATVGAICRLGAKPVFVDIETDGFNIDPSKIEQAVSERTKAIIPVHLFGQMAEMQPILNIASRRGIAIIEDAAQAIGAEYDGRRAGSIGTAGCISFFPSKNLGCFGDGGMIVTNDYDLAERMRIIRNHGARKKYHHDYVGGNFRLDTLQAAVLSVKLPYLDDWNATRRRLAQHYANRLADMMPAPVLSPPTEQASRFHVYNQFVVRCHHDRDRLQSRLASRGIPTAVYYPVGLHIQRCFEHLGYRAGDFPECERACEQVLALPMHPTLKISDVDRIVDAVCECVRAEE